MKSLNTIPTYKKLLADIGLTIESTRTNAVKAINTELVKSNREIGRHIVGFSTSLISETLSRISPGDKHLLKLTWSHFVLLIKMVANERQFYELESAANNWSTRELERQYNSSLYERLSLSKDKKKVKQLSKKGQLLQHPNDIKNYKILVDKRNNNSMNL